MRRATGDPTRSAACILVKTLGEIVELFTSSVLDILPKDKCSAEAVEAIVGNKAPEAFARVVKVNGDFSTHHTERLNRLIVKNVVDTVISSTTSREVPMIHDMVEETKVIIKELFC